MKLKIEKSVVVITPTIGSDKLNQCIDSVNHQTYKNLTHLVVFDGPEYFKMDGILVDFEKSRQKFTCSPYNTGKNGYNGQRIYAAYPHLIDSDYILFCDEDNSFKPDHVETLVELIEKESLDFAYSLRSIYDTNSKYLCDDNCESLGLWPIFFTHDNPQYLVDTSAYCFTKNFIQKTCHLWHSGPWGEDRRYFNAVKDIAKFNTTGKHTLMYRLGGNPNSVKEDFFIQGNQMMLNYYGGKYPWI